jgi:hypothetical protein
MTLRPRRRASSYLEIRYRTQKSWAYSSKEKGAGDGRHGNRWMAAL